ncbi:MAG: PepSY-like domain-containing protein [Bacteroidetes bacterium]|nr:PepSY-like domain-containing protein [Bacteroidota bacterium]
MKNVLIILALLFTLWTQSCAQTSENQHVPEKVKTAFSQKFPKAKKVKWEKENESEWEAEFKMDGKEYSANFSLNGDWMETEYEIKESAIPANIKTILDNNFSNYEIEEAEMAETSSGNSYEFEIEQGEEVFEVVIDAQGNVSQKKKEDDDDDDED